MVSVVENNLEYRKLHPADARTLRDLDFARIRGAVAARAQTELGRTRCASLPLLTTTAEVREQLSLLGQLMAVAREEGQWPVLAGVGVIEEAVTLASRGGVLEPLQLMDIATTLSTGERAANWCVARRAAAPGLAAMMDAFGDYQDLVRDIDRTFEPSGRISDDASPELKELRRKAAGLREALSGRMEGLVRELDEQGLLQDRYHTIREDRFVLPVKANERWRVEGIVHDTSNTNQTFFIEPQEVVDLGNRLKMAVADVQEEERRILKALSARVGRHAREIGEDLGALHDLDVLAARARLGVDLRCEIPQLLEPTASMELRSFRHPVLTLDALEQGDAARVIANDLFAGKPPVLVITGPNTGGKTVALKGIGLCALMVRAGLAIPVAPESRMPLYDRIYSVLGDGQSLEANLSSFGAHLFSVRQMMDGVAHAASAREGCLCVLDEVMAGTDPEQGAALAQAVLEALAKTGAHVVATTHFEKLKALALDEEGKHIFRNASVGLHPATLRPTYRLSYDAPGASSALDMAEQLGIPRDVVDRARTLGSEQGRRLDALLRSLADRQALLDEEKARLEAERAALEEARRRADARAADLREQERTLKHRARHGLLEETQRIRRELEDATDRARKALRAAEEERRGDAVKDAQAAVGRVGELSHELARQVAEQRRRDARKRAFETPLQPGSKVHIVSLDIEGEVLELDEREAVVKAGALRVRVPTSELAAPEKRPPPPHIPVHAGSKSLLRDDNAGVERVLDLRGERVEDALEKLDAFLDRAWGREVGPLTVIHGHGTGALRKAVRQALKDSPHVAHYEKAPDDQGGNGITLVTLREQ